MSLITLAENRTGRFARYLACVHTFPVMAYAPPDALSQVGIDFLALDEWAMLEDPDGREGILPTVQFVLNLWSSSHPWKVGAFDMFRALRAWDSGQLAAFQAWAAAPWRP